MFQIIVVSGGVLSASYEFNGPLPTHANFWIPVEESDETVRVRIRSVADVERIFVTICSHNRCSRWKFDIDKRPYDRVVLHGTDPNDLTVEIRGCDGPCE